MIWAFTGWKNSFIVALGYDIAFQFIKRMSEDRREILIDIFFVRCRCRIEIRAGIFFILPSHTLSLSLKTCSFFSIDATKTRAYSVCAHVKCGDAFDSK